MKLCGIMGFKYFVLSFMLLSSFAIVLSQEEIVEIFGPSNELKEDDEAVARVQRRIEIIMNELNLPELKMSHYKRFTNAKVVEQNVCFDADFDRCPAKANVVSNRLQFPNYSIFPARHSFKSVLVRVSGSRLLDGSVTDNSNLKKLKSVGVRSSPVRTNRATEPCDGSVQDGDDFDERILFGPQEDSSTNEESKRLKKGFFINDCVIPNIIPEKFSKLTGIRKLFPSANEKTYRSGDVAEASDNELDDDFASNNNRGERNRVMTRVNKHLKPIYDALQSIQDTLDSGDASRKVVLDGMPAANELIKRLVYRIQRDLNRLPEKIEKEISRDIPIKEDQNT